MSKALDILFETRAETRQDASRMLVAKVPEMQHLRLLPSFYSPSDKPDNESNYHWTTLKCRTIIFNDRYDGLLASPSYCRPNYIDIIVSKNNSGQEEFRTYLKSLNLHFSSDENLTLLTYERCLRYSILARLSPMWNQVGPYIIPGRDFLTETKPMDALKINFAMNGSDLNLVMWPVRVKLWPMLSEHFAAEPINQDCTYRLINYTTAFVMPSLKEAEVCFLSTKLPENSVFSSYEEVKKYWKNTHGYRLPEEQNGGVTYMSVRFSPRLPVMTYPLACLQSHPPTVLKVKNETAVISEFLSDLLRRMPVICGCPFGTQASVGVAVQKLVNDTIFAEESHLLSIPAKRFTQINPKFLEEPNNERVLESYTSGQKPVSSSSSYMCASNDTDDNTAGNAPKYKPIFTCKKETSTEQVRNEFVPGPSNRGNPIRVDSTKFTPIFIPRNKSLVKSTPTSMSSQVSSSSGLCYQQHSSIKGGALLQPSSQTRLMPSCHPHVRDLASMSNASIQQKFTPLFLPRTTGTTIKPAVKSAQLPSPRVSHISSCRTANKYPLFLPQPVNQSAVSSSSDFYEHHCSPTLPIITSQSTELIQMKNFEGSNNRKRSRPQVQTHIDVSMMAQSPEGLARVNTTTLIAYLRNEGISCRVKDKKGELVAKVMAHLNKNKKDEL